jgi:hypothetical protein
MDELDEMIFGKDSIQLRKELVFQIKNQGHDLGGTICSTILERLESLTGDNYKCLQSGETFEVLYRYDDLRKYKCIDIDNVELIEKSIYQDFNNSEDGEKRVYNYGMDWYLARGFIPPT